MAVRTSQTHPLQIADPARDAVWLDKLAWRDRIIDLGLQLYRGTDAGCDA